MDQLDWAGVAPDAARSTLAAETPTGVVAALPRVPTSQASLWGGAGKPIEAIYDNEQIIDRAFAYWRERGFPYRDLTVAECMDQINKLSLTPDSSLWNTVVAYHVADTYNPHRFSASPARMTSPIEAFNSDKLLRRSLRLILEYNKGGVTDESTFMGVICLVSGTQACANFRPGFALSLYRQFGEPGGTILDTSIGYGGRLVGFMASGLGGHYIGIDPSWASISGSARMASDLGFAENVTLINRPAEEAVLPEWAMGNVDFSFTSPPYFTKERYAADHDDYTSQSWHRYPTDTAWQDGFLRPMLSLTFDALKPGGHAALNVADVKLDNKVWPLVEWCEHAAAEVGFIPVERDRVLKLSRRFGQGGTDEVATEPLLIWQKP